MLISGFFSPYRRVDLESCFQVCSRQSQVNESPLALMALYCLTKPASIQVFAAGADNQHKLKTS